MKPSYRATLLLGMILALHACSPFVIASSSGVQPTPVQSSDAAASGYQDIFVDEVKTEVGAGSPIPAQVIVSGNLPDRCAQVEHMLLEQGGTDFSITLSSISSQAEGCVQESLPFKISIPLNVMSLPAGSYTVVVNDTLASSELFTANTRSSLLSSHSDITRDDIEVVSVDMEVGVGSPIPVHAIVGLEQKNTCAQVGEMRLHRDGTTFYIQLISDIAQRSNCKANPPSGSLPFRMEIPLNMVNLPDGSYEVKVNGASTTFDWPAQPTSPQ